MAAFLGYLSVALHKHRAYPPGHPMREEARDLALRALTQVLAVKPVVRTFGMNEGPFRENQSRIKKRYVKRS